MRLSLTALVLLCACSSGTEHGTLIDDPLGELPKDLADVGLYPDLSDRSIVTPEALPYEPRYPLWSNGSDKQRFIVPGGPIDTSEPAWQFAVGTLLFKTFSYGEQPVETRLMRLSDAGWDFATYAWDGDSATLLDGRTLVTADVVNDNGDALTHSIPVDLQCRSCHLASPAVVLGFSALQLAVAPVSVPVSASPLSDDPLTDDFLGLLVGNCTHCHNGSDLPSSAYDLRPTVALDNLIGRPTQGSGSASGVRIVPGDPEQSVLFAAYSGQSDDAEVSPMPPLGVDLRDAQGIATVRAFIESLESP